MRTLLTVLLLVSACAGWGADSAVAAFQAAMAGSDAGAKKQAARALGNKDAGKDEEVFPLLIAAIADRQAGEAAVDALRSRTGKMPVGGLYSNAEDPAKIQAAWQLMYEDWKKGQELKKLEKKVEKDEKAIKDGKKKPESETAPPSDTSQTTPGSEKTSAPMPAEDLGKIDRVIFKAGGSLLCYVQSKRTDADGQLISVRVVHPDGSGEETIDSDLISRIEEDIH